MSYNFSIIETLRSTTVSVPEDVEAREVDGVTNEPQTEGKAEEERYVLWDGKCKVADDMTDLSDPVVLNYYYCSIADSAARIYRKIEWNSLRTLPYDEEDVLQNIFEKALSKKEFNAKLREEGYVQPVYTNFSAYLAAFCKRTTLNFIYKNNRGDSKSKSDDNQTRYIQIVINDEDQEAQEALAGIVYQRRLAAERNSKTHLHPEFELKHPDVHRAIQSLSEERQLLLARHYALEISVPDMAEEDGINVKTMETRVRRAVTLVREKLEKQGITSYELL